MWILTANKQYNRKWDRFVSNEWGTFVSDESTLLY